MEGWAARKVSRSWVLCVGVSSMGAGGVGVVSGEGRRWCFGDDD